MVEPPFCGTVRANTAHTAVFRRLPFDCNPHGQTTGSSVCGQPHQTVVRAPFANQCLTSPARAAQCKRYVYTICILECSRPGQPCAPPWAGSTWHEHQRSTAATHPAQRHIHKTLSCQIQQNGLRRPCRASEAVRNQRQCGPAPEVATASHTTAVPRPQPLRANITDSSAPLPTQSAATCYMLGLRCCLPAEQW